MNKDQLKPVVVKTETAERDGMTVEKIYYRTAAGATKTDEQIETECLEDILNTDLKGRSHEIALIDAGQIKEALEKIREKTEITDPVLIQRMCDITNSEKPRKRGRPSLEFDLDHQKNIRAMVAYYVIQKEIYTKSGEPNPAIKAREDVFKKYATNKSDFEKAHKRFKNDLGIKIIKKYAMEGYLPEIQKTKSSYADILTAIFNLKDKDREHIPLEERVLQSLKNKGKT